MIAKIAYDVHPKPNTPTRTVSNAFKVPFVVNDRRLAGDYYYIPNANNYCNGVRTSPGWNIYPFSGNCEIRSHVGDVWDNNESSLRNGYGSYIFSDGEVTFDFFDPSTDTFVPWTIYTQDVDDLPYAGRTVQGMALRWKDANGNHPPSITGINDYIVTAPNRYRNGDWYDGIIVMFGFDGFAYNPFSQSDPIVARLCIEVSRRDQTAGNIYTYPKLTGSNQRNADGSITSTKVRCMPYQFEYNPILYPDSKGYNVNDPVTAKAIAFGMTNWVRLDDDFKQYIIANHYTEQVAELEYTKYLEFSNL